MFIFMYCIKYIYTCTKRIRLLSMQIFKWTQTMRMRFPPAHCAGVNAKGSSKLMMNDAP